MYRPKYRKLTNEYLDDLVGGGASPSGPRRHAGGGGGSADHAKTSPSPPWKNLQWRPNLLSDGAKSNRLCRTPAQTDTPTHPRAN